ncbi:MAG: flagellar motor switch protein FliN [Solirubrobacteraceae bacterium]
MNESELPDATPEPARASGAATAVSGAVVYEQLDEAPAGAAHAPNGTGENGSPSSAPPHDGADLRRLSDVPMELSVEIGRTRMTVGETLQLRAGSIVTLQRLAGEPVDLLVNGTPLARGEVVIIDEEFGLRVTEIVEGDPAAAGLGEQGVGGDPIDTGHPAPPAPAPPPAAQADPAVQE